MAEFAKLAQPVKLTAVGDGGGKTPPEKKGASAQDEVLRLAEEAVKAGKAKNRPSAISLVLSENKELNDRYQKETQPEA